jgi:hypothetical protein
MEIAELEERVKELKSRLAELRRDYTEMIRYDLAEEETAKVLAEIPGIEQRLLEEKNGKDLAVQKRKDAVAAFSAEFAKSMAAFLPFGTAFLDMALDGKLTIGWNMDGKEIPWLSLSGGQRAVFDTALCYAFSGPKSVILAEGAEADPVYLNGLMKHIVETGPNAQVILCSWHLPYPWDGEPSGWQVVRLEG